MSLELEVEARLGEVDQFTYAGEGQVPEQADNLIHQGYHAGFAALGEAAPTLAVQAFNPIPLARGMGSSSAALVAGAALADAVSGGRLGKDGVFAVTARLEGHPDNVAPAVYGGFVAALAEPPLAIPLPVPKGLRFALGVPAYEVPTPEARDRLPEHVPRADAQFNLARAALWPAALATGRIDALREAARDRLHQPYRASMMPGLDQAIERAYAQGARAVFVGGSGPTLAALTAVGDEGRLLSALEGYVGEQGRVMILEIGGGYGWKEA